MTLCLCGEPTVSRDETLCRRCRDLLPFLAERALSDEEKAAIAIAQGLYIDIVKVLMREVRVRSRAVIQMVGKDQARGAIFQASKILGDREASGPVSRREFRTLFSNLECAYIELRHGKGETFAAIAKSMGIDDSALRMRMRGWRKRKAKEALLGKKREAAEALLRKKLPPEK